MKSYCNCEEDINLLYLNLVEAYTEKNLNKITSDIVSIYKAKQFSQLKGLLRAIYDKEFEHIKTSKCFSKLIMLYHPDKLSHYLKEIDTSYKEKSFEKLSTFSHIFTALDLESAITADIIENYIQDFEPEYIWDFNEEGFSYYTEDELNSSFDDFGSDAERYSEPVDDIFNDTDNSFFTAVKRKIYGSQNVELPGLLLEDLEEIDMAEYEIDNLDGIECCKYVKNLDLSNNFISNISELYTLKQLTELYLANNNIGYIDVLAHLKNLRVLDISNNDIIDISPLFSLENLEYLNIVGNSIPITQRNHLKNKGVIVVE